MQTDRPVVVDRPLVLTRLIADLLQMEILAQYLDDFEDLFYAIALLTEKIRNIVRFFLFMVTSLTLQSLGIFVALASPPIAVAVASLLLVGMLYRGVVRGLPLDKAVS